jgi:hypothetical protein
MRWRKKTLPTTEQMQREGASIFDERRMRYHALWLDL